MSALEAKEAAAKEYGINARKADDWNSAARDFLKLGILGLARLAAPWMLMLARSLLMVGLKKKMQREYVAVGSLVQNMNLD